MNCQKLLILGLTAIIRTNAFAHNPAEQSINRLAEQVQTLQQKNIVPKIEVNFIIKPEVTRSIAHAKNSFHEENCTVNIELNSDMETGYIGTKENREALKDITNPSNLKQQQLRTEFITYHEMAHCRLVEIKNPYKSEDKNAENILNQYYQHGLPSLYSSDSKKFDNSLYDNLQENFADTFSFIQLIKKYGGDTDLLVLIQKIQIERSDLSNTLNKDSLIAHNTEFSIKELLKEENIKQILSIDNEQELENIALNIANKGMWQAIKTHGELDRVSNQFTLVDGATRFFSIIALKNINGSIVNEKNINLDFKDNALFQIGEITYNELNVKFNLKNLKNEAELNSFIEKNHVEIEEVVTNHFYDKIGIESKKGINVFDAVEKHMLTVQLMEKQTVEQLKINGAEAIKNAENLASKLSTNSVLKNVSSFRQSHLHNKTVHIKYSQ